MINLYETRLRSNPRLRLVAFDQLEQAERRTFENLTSEPDFYGLLIPPSGSVLPLKSVSRDAALLFLTLREPACVPHLLVNLFGANNVDRIRELVLDGIFEVEQQGNYVSGAAAFPDYGHDGRCGEAPSSRVGRLSMEAIVYAAALEGMSANELAARLYMYNRIPPTLQLQRRFSDEQPIIAYLAGNSAAATQLESYWTRRIKDQSWIVWNKAEWAAGYNYKLYISPTIDSFPDAFQIALDSFVQVKCSQFKIGYKAFGLVRPDKFVAYFANLEQLQHAAELIRASASGLSAQGVPFSAMIDAEGLVSWGMDPPRFEQVLPWQEHQSWRQWVAERVAVYTLAGKENGADDILDFVRNRVTLDGIDFTTWSPNLAIWGIAP